MSQWRHGLHGGPVKKPGQFEDVGPWSYNTQQHLLALIDVFVSRLHARGAGNGPIIRHVRPLFRAQFDPDRLQVLAPARTDRLWPERALSFALLAPAPSTRQKLGIPGSEGFEL